MRRFSIVVTVLVALLSLNAAAEADEVTEAIAKAEEAYAAENYKDASTELQNALVGVHRILIELIQAQLPEAPSGWTVDDPEGMDASAFGMGFFANLMVSRTYYPPGGSSIEVSIAANSPLIGALQAFVSNPMMAAMSGGEMKKSEICGNDAIEEFSEENDEASINILAGRSTLIAVEGDGYADEDHVRTLAGMIDCAGIVELVE
ncbi:MAG: hypothetical protein GF405_03640 [Candidatus Eisenbacteria bacterium]|nr:hypothetical protein [Candidatus Eisenbacteria bacterium]